MRKRDEVLLKSGKRPDAGRMLSALAALLLLLVAMRQLWSLLRAARTDTAALLHQAPGRIMPFVYGNCRDTGYGYLDTIVPSIPDPLMFPVVRYPGGIGFPQALFPDARTRYDDRLLVGIDLDPDITQQSTITSAALQQPGADGAPSIWTFHTDLDYDLLTGFVLQLANSDPAAARVVEISLYDSPLSQVRLGEWTASIPAGQASYSYELPVPLSNFSHGRGATDFAVRISLKGAAAPQLSGLEIPGVRLDLSGYTVFNRDRSRGGRCFAAIKNSFLKEINTNDLVAWKTYLRKLSNVEPSQ